MDELNSSSRSFSLPRLFDLVLGKTCPKHSLCGTGGHMWSGLPGWSCTIITIELVVVEHFLRAARKISTLEWNGLASPFPFPTPCSRAPDSGSLNARPQAGRCAGFARRGGLRAAWNGDLRQGCRESAIPRACQGGMPAKVRFMRLLAVLPAGASGRRADAIPRRCAALRRAGRPTSRRSCCGCSG